MAANADTRDCHQELHITSPAVMGMNSDACENLNTSSFRFARAIMFPSTEFLKLNDPEIAQLIDLEYHRQLSTLNLVASDNYSSFASLEAQGSILSYKLAEGYPNKRVCGGCSYVDAIEKIAIERAKKLFKADHANVQAPSGTQANMAVYFAALKTNKSDFLSIRYIASNDDSSLIKVSLLSLFSSSYCWNACSISFAFNVSKKQINGQV